MKYKVFTDEEGYLKPPFFIRTNTLQDICEFNPNVLISDHLDCYHIVNGELYLDPVKLEEEITRDSEKKKEAELEKQKQLILTDFLNITKTPSDKLGYDWLIYTLGNVELRREYVPSEGHKGTEEDPIPFELGLYLIPNAFYSYEGHLFVWMGKSGVIATDIPKDGKDGWVQWDI